MNKNNCKRAEVINEVSTIQQSSPFDVYDCMHSCTWDAHMLAHVALVWCMQKIVCATSAYYTFCWGHWNEEMKERPKTLNWVVDYFSLMFVNLSLAWML